MDKETRNEKVCSNSIWRDRILVIKEHNLNHLIIILGSSTVADY